MIKKIKKFIGMVFEVTLNPASPLLTLLVGWLLTLYATVPGAELPYVVKFLLAHKAIIAYAIVLWILLACVYYYFSCKIKELEEKVLTQQASIQEKNSQLQHSAGIIMNKYGEFLGFKIHMMFQEALEEIVNNVDAIDSAQIYSYSKSIKRAALLLPEVVIKLENITGYASEGIDINQILQTYYHIDKTHYDRLQKIVYLWKEVANGISDDISAATLESDQKLLTHEVSSLFKTIYNLFKNVTKDMVLRNEHLYNDYRILTLLYQLALDTNKVNSVSRLLPGEKAELEEFLNQGKRTGILGSILLEDTFIFRHAGPSAKHGRIYVCFPFQCYEKEYCVLFTISPTETYTIPYFEYAREKFLKILKTKLQ